MNFVPLPFSLSNVIVPFARKLTYTLAPKTSLFGIALVESERF